MPEPEVAPVQIDPPRRTDVLVKIETDRRLGHEWDEWDGTPLPNEGDFRTGASSYFLLTAVGIVGAAGLLALGVFLLATRLAPLADRLTGALHHRPVVLAGLRLPQSE